jgi:hypothetical protein
METLEVVVESNQEEQTSLRPLERLHDRCDKCNAEGFMLAVKDDLELVFCGHHGKKFMASLVSQGFDISDETHRINERPSVSASGLD